MPTRRMRTEMFEMKELQKIVDSMNKSSDGYGVGRHHQRAKEFSDSLDWVREMNRKGKTIDEDSVITVDPDVADFPDCTARTRRGDYLGIEVTGPGGRWDSWNASKFKTTVLGAIKRKSEKAKNHRQGGTAMAGLTKMVLLLTLDMERYQVEKYIEELGMQETSEFDEVYVMLSYEPDGGEGGHPVFQIGGRKGN